MSLDKQNGNSFVITLCGGQVSAKESVEIHETPEFKIWLLNPNGENFDRNLLAHIDNKIRHPWEIPGVWAALIKDKASNQFRAISSINNELPWYHLPEAPGMASTSLVELSAKSGLKNPDPVSICSFAALDWSVGGYSLIKGIRKTLGGSILKFSLKNNPVENGIDLTGWLGLDNSVSDRQVLVDQFVEILKEKLNSPVADPRITLTGGSDSRAVLAGALLTGLPFTTTTGVSAMGASYDYKIAQKISAIIHTEHFLVDACDNPAPPFEEIYQKYAGMFDCEFYPPNWIIHYKEFAVYPQKILRIFGYGGEIHSGAWVDVYKRLQPRLSGFNKETAAEVMNRVEARHQKMKDVSERDARDLFYLRERDMCWISANVRAFLPYRFVLMPFRDPRLLGLVFRFKGGIRKSGIHQALMATLPAEIQNLPINRGRLLPYVKLSKRLFPKTNRALLATTDHLLEMIDPEFFDRILSPGKIKRMIYFYSKNIGNHTPKLHKMLGLQYFFNTIS